MPGPLARARTRARARRCTQLQVGNQYYLRWKVEDGWIFSGRLLAESEPFKVVTLQSILLETEQAKQGAKQASAQATSAALTPAPPPPPPSRMASDGCTTAECKVFRKHFDAIDTDHNDSLSSDEIATYMQNYGFDVTEDLLEKMVREADLDNDGEIDFKEFCMIIKKAENYSASKGWLQAQSTIGMEIFEASRVRGPESSSKATAKALAKEAQALVKAKASGKGKGIQKKKR